MPDRPDTTNIAAILSDWAIQQPNQAAIIDRRQTISFASLEQAVQQTAMMLDCSGLRSGDAVLVFQPMSVELYVALLAIFRLGAVAMFLDPAAGLEHLERCCALYPPKALIASTKAHLLRLRSAALRQIPLKVVIGLPVPGAVKWSQARHYSSNQQIFSCTSDTPALLTFTSGSTGQPKAALRTHGFLLAQHRVLAETLQLTPGTIDLTTLPIFGLANLASGVTSLIPDADLRFPGRINAARVMAQIQHHAPQTTAASPAFLAQLANFCEQHQLSLACFQRIYSGGAPVFPKLLQQIQQLAPQAKVTAVYGSTEAEPIAHVSHNAIQVADYHAMSQGKGLLVGKPVPQIQLRILPDCWGRPITSDSLDLGSACSPGQMGEIVVSGDHVLPGYLAGQRDEETKFRANGTIWHRTGDAGYLDEQGRLWLLGRCSAQIVDGHGVLYPFAVEAAANQCFGVKRTATVQHRGQRILLVEFERSIAKNPEKSEAALTNLRQALEWAEIESYRVYENIPVDRRHNAKIDYRALKKLLEEVV